MHILIFDPSSKIPVLKYGGTERVLWDLGRALVDLGHKVTYIVKQGSRCDFANVIEYDPSVDFEFQIPKDTDVIHFHSLIDFKKINSPYLFTLHGNVPHGSVLPENTVCISKNHADRNNVKNYVYNGLDWDKYKDIDLSRQREYYHFLGKATWKAKNLKGACKIAIKSNQKLTVLGGNKWRYKNLKSGFLYKLNPKISYKGMVDNNTKMKIMSKSKGLIFPVKWQEPFGLAIIESLYAGCPVFGSKYGSLSELIINDIGFTSNNDSEIGTFRKRINPCKYEGFVVY